MTPNSPAVYANEAWARSHVGGEISCGYGLEHFPALRVGALSYSRPQNNPKVLGLADSAHFVARWVEFGLQQYLVVLCISQG